MNNSINHGSIMLLTQEIFMLITVMR